jgi:hypothetical protein
MKLVTLCFVSLLTVLSGVGLVAQNRPNFSGVWVDVATNSLVLTVKHDGTSLTYKVDPFSEVTFNMDGSQTPMPLPDGNVILVKGAWEGSRLVVTYYLPEVKQDIRRQTWTSGDGQLVIVTEFVGPPPPPTGRGEKPIKPTPPTKEVFKRR